MGCSCEAAGHLMNEPMNGCVINGPIEDDEQQRRRGPDRWMVLGPETAAAKW